MSDTFSRACGPSTSNGYNRGTDEALKETERAGATSAARREVARGWGKPGRGRATGRRVAPDRNALGSCTTRGRRGGIASGGAFWASGATQRGTTPGVGAASQRRRTGGGRDSGPSVQLQLETTVGDCRPELLAALLPLVQWLDQESADRRVPQSPASHDRQEVADHLGSSAGASFEARARVCRDGRHTKWTMLERLQRVSGDFQWLPRICSDFRQRFTSVLPILRSGQ